MGLRRIRDEQDARRCLAAALESGEHRAVWARRNGVDPRSLNAWRINLGRTAPGPRLLELVPHGGGGLKQPMVVRCGRFSVEVPEEFDEQVLARVLGVLAAC